MTMRAQVGDSVAIVADPEFRDAHYRARQYGRVLEVRERNAHSSFGPFAWVDWSDVGMGTFQPHKAESVHVDSLRVIYRQNA